MKQVTGLLVLLAMLVAGCGGGTSDAQEDPETGAAPVSTTATAAPSTTMPPTTVPPTTVPPTTNAATTITTTVAPAPDGMEVATVSDLTWTTPDVEPELAGLDIGQTVGEEWPLKVIHPVEAKAGGWPVVVVFHASALGTPLGSGFASVARQGAVVVAPRWAPPSWWEGNLGVMPAAEYTDGYWFDVGACALAAAQEVALEYGGDSARTTVVGFSAGVHPAAWTGLGVVRNNLCPDRDPFIPPVGMVLGDGHWLFQGDIWDETFDATDSLARDTVDRYLNPERWVNVPDGFTAYLWSTETGAWKRSVGNPRGVDSWLRTRHDDVTTLLDDLEAVGAFEDELILFDDNSRLHAKRLADAGIDVLHEEFATDHSYNPAIFDRIVEIVGGELFS